MQTDEKVEEPGNKAAPLPPAPSPTSIISNESAYGQVRWFDAPEEVDQSDNHQNGGRDSKQPLKNEVNMCSIDEPCSV